MKLRFAQKVAGVVAAVALTFAPAAISNATTPPVSPHPLPTPVMDTADMFTAVEEQELVARLERVYTERDVVGAVETIAGVPGGQDLAQYANVRANELGVGEAGKDNGILILIDANGQGVRMELGTGISAVVTDARAQLVMEQQIVPQFRQGNFALGAGLGIEAIASTYQPVATVPGGSTPSTAPSDADPAAVAEAQRRNQELLERQNSGVYDEAGRTPLTAEEQQAQANSAQAAIWVTVLILLAAGALLVFQLVRKVKEGLVAAWTRQAMKVFLEDSQAGKEYRAADGPSSRKSVVSRQYRQMLQKLPARHQSWVKKKINEADLHRLVEEATVDALVENEILLEGEDLVEPSEVREMLESRLTSNGSLNRITEEVTEEYLELSDDRFEVEKAETREAEKFWDSLSEEEQESLRLADSIGRRRRLVQQYGGSQAAQQQNHLLPMLVTLGYLNTAGSSSSSQFSGGGGEFGGDQFNGGGGSFGAGFVGGGGSFTPPTFTAPTINVPTFSGGSFSGGGASGSW